MNIVLTPVSPGELIDKITILELKSENIKDQEKLQNVNNELDILNIIWKDSFFSESNIDKYKKELYEVNSKLWDIEDKIRVKERLGEYDSEFIELARSVYTTNDKRSEIKKSLNLYLNSGIIEEKSYQPY